MRLDRGPAFRVLSVAWPSVAVHDTAVDIDVDGIGPQPATPSDEASEAATRSSTPSPA